MHSLMCWVEHKSDYVENNFVDCCDFGLDTGFWNPMKSSLLGGCAVDKTYSRTKFCSHVPS